MSTSTIQTLETATPPTEQDRRCNLGRGRLSLRIVNGLVLGAMIVSWLLWFRPPSLGGNASFVGVDGTSMMPTMHYGDLALVEQKASYNVGDIIAYRIAAGAPGAGQNIIHRIVGGNGRIGFVTKGDHNSYRDTFWHPTTSQVIGRVWFVIPGGMRWIVDLRTPVGFSLFVGLASFALFVWPSHRGAQRRRSAQ